jgi:hypothetical protein
MEYEVFVDNNFHSFNEDERYFLGEFSTADQAIEACKEIVDKFLYSRYKPGMKPEQLNNIYRLVGEDPFIKHSGNELLFSAWDYANEKCELICVETPQSSDDILPSEELLQKAIDIAVLAHSSQKDKSGEPYVGHLFRVMSAGRTLEEKIVGVLHDLIEDTFWTKEMLEEKQFPQKIIDAVLCLTKIEGENYSLYLERVKSNRLALIVKINDLVDNMDIKRLKEIKSNDVLRLNKYLETYRMLTESLLLG